MLNIDQSLIDISHLHQILIFLYSYVILMISRLYHQVVLTEDRVRTVWDSMGFDWIGMTTNVRRVNLIGFVNAQKQYYDVTKRVHNFIASSLIEHL